MPADSPLESRIRRHLVDLESRGLWRALRPPSGVDLSSNDYLGLAADPRVSAAFAAGIEREGCGSTGSRLLRGDRHAFGEVERAFARFKRADRSLFFSSGYLANLAVLSALSEADDVLFSDERNHASLIDGARLSRAAVVVFPHDDLDELSRLLRETPCRGLRFVVVESRYSMDGDVPDLSAYAEICRSLNTVLVVDEAHAVGVDGERGSGLLEAHGVDANACVSINTAGKALGAAGAFVAGPDWLIEYLVQCARPFVFSTAPPPAVADAILASLAIVSGEPERRADLRERSRALRQRLRASGVEIADTTSQIVPVHIGDNARAVAVARDLQSSGFDVRAIRPPTVPAGTARLRLSVNVGLSLETLDRFVIALTEALAVRTLPTGV